ncbi:MAG TPA: hypothetical protein VF988_16505 [Verrucomicrobiae bacterium]
MNAVIETLDRWGSFFTGLAWPMLWQSSLLIVVVWALDYLLARKVRAAVRYALWLVVLVKLLLPPALALPTGPAWWLIRAHPATPAPIVKSFTVTYDQPVPPEALPSPAPLPAAPVAPKLTPAAGMLAAFTAVSAGLLLWLAFRWWQVARMVRRATRVDRFSRVLEDAMKLSGECSGDLRIAASALRSPMNACRLRYADCSVL